VGGGNEPVVKLVVADCNARSIAHISINGTAIISAPGKRSLHLKLDAVAVVVSPIVFNVLAKLSIRAGYQFLRYGFVGFVCGA